MNSQNINREYYNRRAVMWSRRKTDSFWHEDQFRKFLRYFQPKDQILDIGCAYGIHVPLFLGLGRKLRYEGIDISSAMLNIARRRYPQLRFSLTDILNAKTLPRKRYAGFWAGAVLMHIPDQDWPVALGNIENIMIPGAVGYLTLPRRRPNDESERDQRIFSFWTPTKLKRVLSKFNWRILSHGEIDRKNTSDWWWAIVKLPVKHSIR